MTIDGRQFGLITYLSAEELLENEVFMGHLSEVALDELRRFAEKYESGPRTTMELPTRALTTEDVETLELPF